MDKTEHIIKEVFTQLLVQIVINAAGMTLALYYAGNSNVIEEICIRILVETFAVVVSCIIHILQSG